MTSTFSDGTGSCGGCGGWVPSWSGSVSASLSSLHSFKLLNDLLSEELSSTSSVCLYSHFINSLIP